MTARGFHEAILFLAPYVCVYITITLDRFMAGVYLNRDEI